MKTTADIVMNHEQYSNRIAMCSSQGSQLLLATSELPTAHFLGFLFAPEIISVEMFNSVVRLMARDYDTQENWICLISGASMDCRNR